MTKGDKDRKERRRVAAACLRRMRVELREAALLNKTLSVQLKTGQLDAALQTGLEIEPHLHNSNHALQAASVFGRPTRRPRNL